MVLLMRWNVGFRRVECYSSMIPYMKAAGIYASVLPHRLHHDFLPSRSRLAKQINPSTRPVLGKRGDTTCIGASQRFSLAQRGVQLV